MLPVRRMRDRREAGEILAHELRRYAGRSDVIVLGLPRGGVPVAAEISRRLNLPLDIFLVRKLGVPGHEELAMGAIATGGTRVLNPDVLDVVRIPEATIDAVAEREEAELDRRERAYRGDRPLPELEGRSVILVDDGLATGSTMRAAVEAVRAHDPQEVIVAVPVGAPETCDSFRGVVEDVVCAMTPEPFHAVGLWYDDFSQTTDEEVRSLLQEAATRGTGAGNSAASSGRR